MSDKLKLLAKSALAIPGMIAMANAAGPAESEASYRYTLYQEDGSPAARDISGEASERYEIQVHQFHLIHPLNQHTAVTLEGSFESLAGASPKVTFIPTGQSDVYTSFAGASELADEKRFDISAAVRRYQSMSEYGGSAYLSKERDYFALSASTDGALQFNSQMSTISAGLSAGYEWLDPTVDYDNQISDLADPTTTENILPGIYNALDQTKMQVSVFGGFGQVINMNTVMQLSASYVLKTGYLSDPYRNCVGEGVAELTVRCDVRPDTRSMITVSAGLRKYLPKQNAAAHLDYRLFTDNWGVMSHTVDADYFYNWAPAKFFSSRGIQFQLIPGVRYYYQGAADFYEIPDVSGGAEAYTTTTTGPYSSDPRLSKYGALGLKARANISYKSLTLNGSIERYAANPAYGFNFDEQTPGLPAFWRMTTGVDFRF